MIQAIPICSLRTIVGFTMLVGLFWTVDLQIGFTEEGNVNRENFQISIDTERVVFTVPPIFKEGKWFVPLEHFAEQLGLKIEYPEGTKMAVLCGGKASELCVPLQFQDSEKGVVDIDGVNYVQPARVTEPFGFEIYEVSANRLEVIHAMYLAPEFSLPDLEGTPKRLRDFRGKKTLLYVWGSW